MEGDAEGCDDNEKEMAAEVKQPDPNLGLQAAESRQVARVYAARV